MMRWLWGTAATLWAANYLIYRQMKRKHLRSSELLRGRLYGRKS